MTRAKTLSKVKIVAEKHVVQVLLCRRCITVNVHKISTKLVRAKVRYLTLYLYLIEAWHERLKVLDDFLFFLFTHNKLHCITMKLYSALRSLTTASKTPGISSGSTFMRLAKPSIGQRHLTSQILSFSTAARLQARGSKRPKRDPRISPSPPKPSLSNKLNMRPP